MRTSTMLLTRILVLVVVCRVHLSTSKPTENGTEVWTRLEMRVQYLAKEGSMRVWNWIKNQSSEMQLSDDCRGSLFNLLKDAGGLKRWATQMLDASGKPVGGILNGKLGFYGNFDECVNIAVPRDYDLLQDIPDNPFKFRGQYCLVDVRPPLPKMGRFLYHWQYLPPLKNLSQRPRIKPFDYLVKGMGYIYDLPFRTAVCAPSTCSQKDLKKLIFQLASPYGLKVHVDNCSIKKPTVLSNDIIVIIVVLTFLLSLVVVGTMADYNYTKRIVRQRVQSKTHKPSPPSTFLKVLFAFSLRRNMRNLLSTKIPPDTTFSALAGVRFITMVWVVMGHTSLTLPPFFYRHGKIAKDLMSEFVMQFMYNSFLSVDTFFFVSSTLFSYFMVKSVNKKGLRSFNVPIIVVRRIWRLLPLELLLIGIAELASLLNNAPLWNEYFDTQRRTCRKSWWTIILFVQNLIYPKDTCHLHLWYVSMDFQFFLVSIVYLSIYFRKPLAGKIFILMAFVGGILTTCLVTYSLGFPPSIHMVQTNLREIIEFFQFWYLLPYSHISVCAIGMFVGTFLVNNSNFKISMKAQVFGWTLAMLGFAAPIYTTYFWHFGRDLHPAEISIYNGIHRPVWALALSWLTIMCATGRGGFINELLSWKGYLPLNRSSYVLYLIHITVCQYYFRSLTGQADPTKTGLFWYFFAIIILSYAISVILRVLFEAPLEQLDKLFFSSFLTRARDSSPNRMRNATDEKETRIRYRGKKDRKRSTASNNRPTTPETAVETAQKCEEKDIEAQSNKVHEDGSKIE